MADHETSSYQKDSPEIEQTTVESSDNTLAQELEQWKDKALRVTADFANMRQRYERERQQWTLIAQKEIILPLLAVADDVDRAMKQKQPENLPEEIKSWYAGFGMVHKAFEAFLKKIGVEKIAVTEQFDPALHESIGSIHSDMPVGSIAQVVQDGYLLNGVVIRPARVLVAG